MSEITIRRGNVFVSCPRAEYVRISNKNPEKGTCLYIEWVGIKIKAAEVKERIAILVFSDELLFDKKDGMHHGGRIRHEFRKWYKELPPVHQILEDVLEESRDDYFRERDAFSIGLFIKKSEIGEVFEWKIDPF